MLIVGPIRSGKTATLLKPMIYQLLLMKKRGVQLGLSVIEPKGDMAFMVREMAEAMELPFVHIDPARNREYAIVRGYDPSYKSDTFNPMKGDMDTVAEATVSVLKSLFGKQDPFFATVQELAARNTTKLLKMLYGDNIDLIDVVETLRDAELLEKKVKELKVRDGATDLVRFFESELLGSLRDKYRQFAIGLRAQLENLTSNTNLKAIMGGKDSLNIDEHFLKGGILAVNTALGELGTSGDAFGQFVVMHLQSGTFRRPGTERTRVPHFLIVDELSRYINPDFERFLSIAAEYRVAGIFATQSLAQLEVESGKMSGRAIKRSILNGCRNKIVFGGVTAEDAKEFAEELGKRQMIERRGTYANRIFIPNLLPEKYQDVEIEEYRYYYSQIMYSLPRFHFIHKLMKNGVQQTPGIGKGSFVPKDWKERREWEKNESKSKFIFYRLNFWKKKEKEGERKKHEPIERQQEQQEQQENETTRPANESALESSANKISAETVTNDKAEETQKTPQKTLGIEALEALEALEEDKPKKITFRHKEKETHSVQGELFTSNEEDFSPPSLEDEPEEKPPEEEKRVYVPDDDDDFF